MKKGRKEKDRKTQKRDRDIESKEWEKNNSLTNTDKK